LEVQGWLQCIGYTVATDGVFGPDTYRDLVAYQQSARLEADGLAGPATQAALEDACSAGDY
jgi:peptidoglycan hydrolase-like protein with peptidoglycan-binding domain